MSKTKKVMLGVTTMLGGTLAGCAADAAIPPQPEDPYCAQYEYDYSDEEWECDDRSSRHYTHFYVGNTAYPDTDAYKSKKISTGKKSGFGGVKVSGS